MYFTFCPIIREHFATRFVEPAKYYIGINKEKSQRRIAVAEIFRDSLGVPMSEPALLMLIRILESRDA